MCHHVPSGFKRTLTHHEIGGSHSDECLDCGHSGYDALLWQVGPSVPVGNAASVTCTIPVAHIPSLHPDLGSPSAMSIPCIELFYPQDNTAGYFEEQSNSVMTS